MHATERRRRAGFTLVEALLACVLFTIFAGAAIVMSRSVSDAFRVEASSAEFDVRGCRVIGKLTRLLRNASADSVLPAAVSAPNSSPWIEFQRIEGYDAGVLMGNVERLTLLPDPGDPADGVDNDGDGMTDEGQLVLIENEGLSDERHLLICTGVAAALEGEVLGNNVDDNGNGLVDEKGFCIEFDGSTVTVHLTLLSGVDAGARGTTTIDRPVALRDAK